MELVSEAINFAVKAHDGMRRKKGNIPYILHPIEAAVIVSTMTSDQTIIAAAALHDVVEDTDIGIDEIKEFFGEEVARLVASETEDKRAELPPADTWKIRKEESLQVLSESGTDVMMLWLGDKLSNLRAIYRDYKIEGNALWQRFHQKDPATQAWYYTTIANLTSKLSDTSAWIEYKKLTELIFGEGSN